jgi:ribosomal protein S18 acetylase RimI-like enzyme
MYQFNTLEHCSITELTNTFNEAFSDYIVPFHLSEQQLQKKCIAEDTDLRFSVGAFHNNKLVGFILHAKRNAILYNGGTGVIPAHRGKALTKKMYTYLWPKLADKIQHIQLEVITSNTKAIQVYEQLGFTHTRTLHCYKGDVNTHINVNANLHRIPLASLPHQQIANWMDVIPSWQNNLYSIQNAINDVICLAAFANNTPTAYAIYHPTNKRLMQIAVAPSFRRKHIASALITHIAKAYGHPISITNIDANNEACNGFIQHMGLQKSVSQYEMMLQLNKK